MARRYDRRLAGPEQSHTIAKPMTYSSTALVSTMLHLVLPGLSQAGRDAIDRLLDERGRLQSAESLAHAVGLRNRHQLAYVLQRDGLPPAQHLAAWLRLLIWVAEYELEGTSICRASLHEARDPAYRYRLVKRLTGLDWTAVRQRGTVWLLHEFIGRCHLTRENQLASLRHAAGL